MSIKSITARCDKILAGYSASKATSRSEAIQKRIDKVYQKHQVLIGALKFISFPLCFMFWALIDGAIKGRAVSDVDDAIALKKLQKIKKISGGISSLTSRGISFDDLEFSVIMNILKENGIDLEDQETKTLFTESPEVIFSLAQKFPEFHNTIDKNVDVQRAWGKLFGKEKKAQHLHAQDIRPREQKLERSLKSLKTNDLEKEFETCYKNKRIAAVSQAVEYTREKLMPFTDNFGFAKLTLQDSSRGSLASFAYKNAANIGHTNYMTITPEHHTPSDANERQRISEKILEINTQIAKPLIALMNDLEKLGLSDKALNELADLLEFLITQDAGCFLNGTIKSQLGESFLLRNFEGFFEFNLDEHARTLKITLNAKARAAEQKSADDYTHVLLDKMIRYKLTIEIDLTKVDTFVGQINAIMSNAGRTEQLQSWITKLRYRISELTKALTATDSDIGNTITDMTGRFTTTLRTLKEEKADQDIITTLTQAITSLQKEKVSKATLDQTAKNLEQLRIQLQQEKKTLETEYASQVANMPGPKFTVDEIELTDKSQSHKIFNGLTFADLETKSIKLGDIGLNPNPLII